MDGAVIRLVFRVGVSVVIHVIGRILRLILWFVATRLIEQFVSICPYHETTTSRRLGSWCSGGAARAGYGTQKGVTFEAI